MTSPIGQSTSATPSTAAMAANTASGATKPPYVPAADVVANLTPGERSTLARMTTNVNARGTVQDKNNLATYKMDLHAREMSKLSADVYNVGATTARLAGAAPAPALPFSNNMVCKQITSTPARNLDFAPSFTFLTKIFWAPTPCRCLCSKVPHQAKWKIG